MKRIAASFIAVIVLFATGCNKKPADNAKIPITPPADSVHAQGMPNTPFQAQLDSGNASFRAKDYTGARDHYARATEIDSLGAAAWFGVYMAEQKLGNNAQADYAMKRANKLNPSFAPGAHGGEPKKESTL